ncbi:nuclear protein 96-domain-containing protein [Leucosporidium creatinivorum]|uniref:Nuclear protein 96-domain-containing protein n=1 Tax=Leucosporidium creatinivorum TaxID=106004 RepID=A0A1Y2CZ10_9BASI|nr:nuclear protein 96-domain-containing protein [Leucosporidium creatinivorum]
MARFGLSDTESDSDHHSQHSQSASSSPPPPRRSNKRSSRSVSYASTQHSDDDQPTEEEQEEDDQDAPPRASLAYSDTDHLSHDDEPEDDASMDQDDSLSPPPRQRRRSTRDDSYSYSLSIDRSSSASPELAPQPTRQQPQPWASKLKLEPKRVAVMQASFFQQSPSDSTTLDQQRREKEQNKAANAVAALAARNGLQAAASPFGARAPASVPSVPAPPIDPTPFRPYRTYTRVPLSSSITNSKEGNLVDLGLALGRSFRVGWGPKGEIVKLGTGGASDKLRVERFEMLDSPETPTHLRLLTLQLSHTTILPGPTSSSIPSAIPSPSLRFSHFLSTLPTTSHSEEANLWRLGQALFDEIPQLAIPSTFGSEERRYVEEEVRRRRRVEGWLEEVVRGEVEDELRSLASGGSKAEGVRRVFTLLSGHQIERACEAALEAGDLRLATLVAQAGGDDEYREDLYLQLAKWREYKVDSHIDPAYRRVYELLCGNVGVSGGRGKGDKVDGCEEINIAEGLGWKRALGLHLWYGTFQAPIATAVERYEAASSSSSPTAAVASPTPSYLPSSSTTTWAPSNERPQDPLYHLLKLYVSPTHSLSSVLLPTNFSSSPLDYRLSWHLYVLLSRVLRRRDFEDRVQIDQNEMEDGDGEGEKEGNSVRADAMTVSYADQVEALGLWEWSTFVLLHLEMPEGREKAIRDLLTRNATGINDETFAFLTETLKIPQTWLYAAQATAEHYNLDLWSEYRLHLAAEQWSQAHEIVVLHLAPEAVIRGDLGLVKRLLECVDERGVEGWEGGGKTFLDYVSCLEQQLLHQRSLNLPTTTTSTEAEAEAFHTRRAQLLAVIDAVQALGARYSGAGAERRKLRVAVAEMQSRLMVISRGVEEYLARIQPSTLQEADRLVWVQGANSNFLSNSLQAACAA